MVKFRLYYDVDKEAEWLNEWSEKGYAMKSFFAGFYTFEACEKGKYLYQIDALSKFGTVSEDYKEFMQEAGVEIVQVWGPWVVLRREASMGPFELYTDVESKIQNFKKRMKVYKVAAIVEIICFMIEMISALRGSDVAMYFAILVGLFVFVFCRAIFNTTRNINRLRAQNGEMAVEENTACKRTVSPLMAAGNLFMLCGLFINEDQSPLMDNVKLAASIIACVLLLAGIYLTMKGNMEHK